MTKIEILKQLAEMHEQLKTIGDAVVELPTQECVDPGTTTRLTELLRAGEQNG